MLFSDAFFELLPDRPHLPAHALMQAFLDAGFEPTACRDQLRALIPELDLDPAWFDFESMARGGVTASERLLFDLYQADCQWRWQMYSPIRRSFSLSIDPDELDVVGEILRRGSTEGHRDEFRAQCEEALGSELAERIWPPALAELPRRQHGLWPRVFEPGIYRREHASLVLRSRTTTLVTDPQGYSRGWTTNGGRFPDESAPLPVDAVLLSHSHDDHWHLPSILRMARAPEVPVIVPRVPRPSLLCPENMADSLRLVGQNVLDPPWWSSIEVGDFVIDVLPFYGEQPLRERSGVAPDARNWGNCYRFTCPEFSVAILVDSGADPMGDMTAVLERSVAHRGPIDVVMSTCFHFPEGYNGGLPMYFLTVPLQHLREFFLADSRGSMTLGADGLVAACRAASCRYFLPYAHGFQGLFRTPRSAEGGRQLENEALGEIQKGLGDGRTEILSWRPGDVARIEGRRVTMVHGGQPE